MQPNRNAKYAALKQRLHQLGRVAVAFSGGLDSTFLLKVAHDALGADAMAITAVTAAVPRREQEIAAHFCRQEDIRLLCCPVDLLDTAAFRENPPDRCYFCKKALFSVLQAQAVQAGFSVLVEGSNLDDVRDYRPGMAAVRELGAISPLLEAELTKEDLRALSRQLGLSIWNRPSTACLASRIAYGEPITAEKLALVEQAEALLSELGLGQLRVRLHGTLARIEVLPEQFSTVLAHRTSIVQSLKKLGCSYVTLDLLGFRTGSGNEILPDTIRNLKIPPMEKG